MKVLKLRRTIIPACLVVLVAGAIAWRLGGFRETEPTYQGDTLSVWLERYLCHRGWQGPNRIPDPLEPEAERAVRQIGTKGIPTLLRLLNSPSWRPMKERVAEVAIRFGFTRVVPRSWIRQHPFEGYELARAGLWPLGPEAKDAIPGLLDLWHQRWSQTNQSMVPEDLIAFIDYSAREAALPAILLQASNRNSSARCHAAMDLAFLRVKTTVSLPELIRLMHDEDAQVRATAATAVIKFSSRPSPVTTLGAGTFISSIPITAGAEPAVPALRELLEDRDPRVQQSARSALSEVESQRKLLDESHKDLDYFRSGPGGNAKSRF